MSIRSTRRTAVRRRRSEEVDDGRLVFSDHGVTRSVISVVVGAGGSSTVPREPRERAPRRWGVEMSRARRWIRESPPQHRRSASIEHPSLSSRMRRMRQSEQVGVPVCACLQLRRTTGKTTNLMGTISQPPGKIAQTTPGLAHVDGHGARDSHIRGDGPFCAS